MIIVAALVPVMPAGEALGVALVSRLLFVFTDVLAAGIATLSGLAQARRLSCAPAG